jgi:hypothetical protein
VYITKTKATQNTERREHLSASRRINSALLKPSDQINERPKSETISETVAVIRQTGKYFIGALESRLV